MHSIIVFAMLVRRLRNAEHFDLFENIVLHGNTLVLPASVLPSWNVFTGAFHHEDLVFKRPARREETELIQQAHKKRKTSYLAYKRFLEAASYSETTAVQEAAVALLKMLDNYAAAYYAPMTEASALIVNLLEDLEKARYAAMLALLPGAAELVAHIRRDNTAFMDIYSGRTFGEEELKVEGSMSDARKAVDKEFANLADTVNAAYRINELQPNKDPDVSATLANLIMYINSYIHQYEVIYSRRTPNYHSAKDDVPPPPEGEGEEEEETPGEDEGIPDEPLIPDNPNEGGGNGPVEE